MSALHQVSRWTRASRIASPAMLGMVVLLAVVPLVFGADVTQQLTTLLVFVLLAVMWNALAGYGGLISIGQQAFIGLGAYGTIFLTQRGLTPYVAMAAAAAAAGLIGLVVSPLALRLRGAQFAIGMWVTAEVFGILVSLDSALGGGTGTSLSGLNVFAPGYRQAYTYWMALAFVTVLLGVVFLVLRGRLGIALQAIRDDEQGAVSLGVRARFSKSVLFTLAALGCGAAGALYLANALFIEPQSVFGVQWSAYVIFMVLVGGLGTFEGPIIGAVIYYLIQAQFANTGAWYFVGLGATAIVFALFVPRGLWGELQRRLHVELLPLGYRLTSRGGDLNEGEPAALPDTA